MQRKFEAGQATGFDIERTRAGVVALRVEQSNCGVRARRRMHSMY